MAASERSIGELFNDVTNNVRLLFRQEIALARAELAQNLANARRGAVMIGAGLAMAWMGMLMLIAALCLTLVALGLPPVASAFLVAVVLLASAFLLVRSGKASLTPERVAPQATVETIKDNAQLLRGQTR